MVGRVCLLCLWEEGKGGEMEIVHVLPWTAHLVVCLMRYEGFFVPSSSSNISPAPSRSTRTFVSSEIGSTKTNLRLPLSFSLSRWQCSKNGCLLKKKKVAFDFFFTSISNDLTTKWFKEFVSSSPVSLRPPSPRCVEGGLLIVFFSFDDWDRGCAKWSETDWAKPVFVESRNNHGSINFTLKQVIDAAKPSSESVHTYTHTYARYFATQFIAHFFKKVTKWKIRKRKEEIS